MAAYSATASLICSTVPTTARSAGALSLTFAAVASSGTTKKSACTDLRTVAGSRPSFSHAASSLSMTGLVVSGVPHVFHSCAKRAVSLSMRGPPVPTRIGSGFCTGFGSHGQSVISKWRPLKVVRSFASIEDTISIASANLSTRSFASNNSMPNALCSFTCQPAPMPSTKRPPDMLSIVAARLAMSAGWFMVVGVTSEPSRMRDVTAARPESTLKHSLKSPAAVAPSTVFGM